MKRFVLSMLVFVLLTFNFTKAKVEAGIIPGDVFYGLDRFVEKLKLFMALDWERKINLRMTFYEERISELEECVKKNRTEFVDMLLKEIKSETPSIVVELNKLEIEGKDVTNAYERMFNVTYDGFTRVSEIAQRLDEKHANKTMEVAEIIVKAHQNCWESLKNKDAKKASLLMMDEIESLVNLLEEGKTRQLYLKMLEEDIVSAEESLERASYAEEDYHRLSEKWMRFTHDLLLNLSKALRKCDGCKNLREVAEKVLVAHTKAVKENEERVKKMILEGGKIRCSNDFDCASLDCPKVVGLDTQVCYQRFCFCGSRRFKSYSVNFVMRKEKLASLLEFAIKREFDRMFGS
ncbi:MAG: hypothetical protein J7K98_03065 [Candidatus Aenigmarchaeota archaeon]|nr:hypothetical protein [Candidatus Aenigmarchaeota archaeon]